MQRMLLPTLWPDGLLCCVLQALVMPRSLVKTLSSILLVFASLNSTAFYSIYLAIDIRPHAGIWSCPTSFELFFLVPPFRTMVVFCGWKWLSVRLLSSTGRTSTLKENFFFVFSHPCSSRRSRFKAMGTGQSTTHVTSEYFALSQRLAFGSSRKGGSPGYLVYCSRIGDSRLRLKSTWPFCVIHGNGNKRKIANMK